MTQRDFRLQSLLKLRQAARDRCREQLADAYRAEQVLAEREAAFRSEIAQARNLAVQQCQPGSLQVDGLLQAHRYELLVKAQLQQLVTQRTGVREETERRRQALVQADQEVRILEKLRDRHARERREAEEKQAGRQLDEIANRRTLVHRGGKQP